MSALTDQQHAAVHARGNVLVVAGAGTGKTSTLVARCLRLIREGGSLENILLVTFTEAAAAEMRQRIRTALEEEWQQIESNASARPQREHLEEQLALIDSAHISTLHGFCLQLIRGYFHLIPVDPQIIVLDDQQAAPLIQQALETVLLKHYGRATPESESVRRLIRGFGNGSDEPIRALIRRIHRYSQSRGDTAEWLAAQETMFGETTPEGWRQQLRAALDDWREEWTVALQLLNDIPVIAESLASLGRIRCDAELAVIVAALGTIQAADADTKKWAKRKGEARKGVASFFDEVVFLQSQFPSPDGTDPMLQDWQQVRGPMQALLRLAREFTTEFSRLKRELGGVDFADLEQFALRLLRDDANGVAAACREKFHHVFVDEYQDINGAQDAILTSLSRTGSEANLFLVGDVKQSIYRFRLANPGIFRAYEAQWGANTGAGMRLPLTENFRSREAILEFVNAFFTPLMREDIGGVPYDGLARLVFGASAERAAFSRTADADGAGSPRIELHLLAKPEAQPEKEGEEPEVNGDRGADDVMDLDAAQREARLIAHRLRELHQAGTPVWDKEQKCFRAVKWQDMVVLLRSPRGKAEVFAQEFHATGVPLQAARGGFFDTLEVMDLLNLLRLLDNPLQDVPLLAVLRSPLAAFSPDELSAFRAHNRELLAWTGLQVFQRDRRAAQAAGSIGTAWRKADEFLSRFTRWRELIRKTSLSHTLETALNETHYEALLLAGSRGPERLANVRRLLDLARDYDPFQRQGLHRFLRFVDVQIDAEVVDESASAPASDTVRLMSIHQSKGLEFPVVVVADLGKQFNEQGLREAILLDEKYGVAPRIMDEDSGAQHWGVTWWLARRREARELRGEEMRLLYVAMTRARDRLLLTGSTSWAADRMRWEAQPGGQLTGREVGSARRCLDWLLRWLPLATTDGEWTSDTTGRNGLFSWEIHTAAPAVAEEAGAPVPVAEAAIALRVVDVAELQQRFSWRYPFLSATEEPAKTSVTALKRRWQQEDEEASAAEWAKVHAAATARAKAAVAGKLSPAEIGIAHHTFLQFIELDRTASLLDLRNEAAHMVEAGMLSAVEVEALNFDALLAFWQSEVGRAIQRQAGHVEREVPFTLRVTPDELAKLTGKAMKPEFAEGFAPQEDFMVLQGFADLIVRRDKEIWLLDFKTDQVTAATLPDKLATYRPQLRVYGEALAKIYGVPVTKKWLHFLALNRSVEVE